MTSVLENFEKEGAVVAEVNVERSLEALSRTCD